MKGADYDGQFRLPKSAIGLPVETQHAGQESNL